LEDLYLNEELAGLERLESYYNTQLYKRFFTEVHRFVLTLDSCVVKIENVPALEA
jgi:hypothetical protein